jgi:hypothetical protein
LAKSQQNASFSVLDLLYNTLPGTQQHLSRDLEHGSMAVRHVAFGCCLGLSLDIRQIGLDFSSRKNQTNNAPFQVDF